MQAHQQSVGTPEGRKRVSRLVWDEAQRLGLGHIRVARRGPSGRPKDWGAHRGQDHAYDWRCVLPSECVIDLGDHGDWAQTRRDTHAVLTVLNRWQVPYWCALSGGKGVHVHVFVEPSADPEWFRSSGEGEQAPIDGDPFAVDLRREFGTTLLGQATDQLDEDSFYEMGPVEADERLLAPAPNARLVREFGSMKWNHKTLWETGPGLFRRLPEERQEAYDVVGLAFPEEVEHARDPPGVLHARRDGALYGSCPQGPSCFPNEGQDPAYGSTCQDCPTAR